VVFPRHACRARAPLRARAAALAPVPAPRAVGRALDHRARTAAVRPAVVVAERWEEAEEVVMRPAEQVRPVRRVDQVVNPVVRVLAPRRAIVAAWAA
jgi:hypothetical protein